MAAMSGLPPDVNRGPEMVRAIWIMDGIAAVVVALRIFTSGYVQRRVGWSDGFMVLALVSRRPRYRLNFYELTSVMPTDPWYCKQRSHHSFGLVGLGSTYNVSVRGANRQCYEISDHC